MPRAILEEAYIHPAIRSKIATHQSGIVTEVQAAVAAHPVVVVGMKTNPMVGRARKALAGAGLTPVYLEYGSYLSQWRKQHSTIIY